MGREGGASPKGHASNAGFLQVFSKTDPQLMVNSIAIASCTDSQICLGIHDPREQPVLVYYTSVLQDSRAAICQLGSAKDNHIALMPLDFPS